MKYDILDLKDKRISCKIGPKFQNSLEILLKVTWISIYQAFVQNKYSQNYPAVSSINNVGFKAGGGHKPKANIA